MHTLVPDLDHLRDYLIQKITVMRNQDVSLRIPMQVVLQPVPAFQVEMVGWLIQQQQRRLLQQQFSQRNPHLPTAGKLFRIPLPIYL